MSRDLATDLLAAIQAGSLTPRLFYEGQFRNTGTLAVEYLRLWSGLGDITWNGYTWSGAGTLLALDGIEETTQNRSVGFKVSLAGLNSAILTIAIDADKSKYLPGTIWLAALDSTGVVIADPYLARSGLLNRVAWTDSGERCDITAEYEDENVEITQSDGRRYTPEDQAIDYPGDKGFDQVAELQDKVIQF